MKLKARRVLDMAVENGTAYGVRRFYKHREDSPDEATLVAMASTIAGCVLEEVDQWFEDDDEA